MQNSDSNKSHIALKAWRMDVNMSIQSSLNETQLIFPGHIVKSIGPRFYPDFKITWMEIRCWASALHVLDITEYELRAKLNWCEHIKSSSLKVLRHLQLKKLGLNTTPKCMSGQKLINKILDVPSSNVF